MPLISAITAAPRWLAVTGVATLLLGAALIAGPAGAQDFGDTPYVQTPQNVVDRMLEVAKVGAGDYVIDLGSGDGRMVITAAKQRGARGFGVDLDRRLVQLANRLAARAGVADRAKFYERDLYQTDLAAASVVTIYLLPEVNLMVRPKLLATLKPGTRVVSHDYDMGEWPPDLRFEMDAPGKPVGRDQRSKVFYWVVPGNAAGTWRWQLTRDGVSEEHVLSVTQNFQMLQGSLMAGKQRFALRDAKLTGEEIAFEAVDAAGTAGYRFTGRITGQTVSGTVRLPGGIELPWNGTRTEVGTPVHALLKKPELQELMLQQQGK